MTDPNSKSPLAAMRKFLEVSLEESDANCDGFEYQPTVKMLKDTSITSQNALSGSNTFKIKCHEYSNKNIIIFYRFRSSVALPTVYGTRSLSIVGQ